MACESAINLLKQAKALGDGVAQPHGPTLRLLSCHGCGETSARKLQKVLFPEGLAFDGQAFQTPVTCLFFRDFERSEGDLESLVARTGFALVGGGWLGTESPTALGNAEGRKIGVVFQQEAW